MKRKLLIAAVILVSIIILLGVLGLSYDMRISDESLLERYDGFEDVSLTYAKVLSGDSVRYIRRGDSQRPLVVMVHGAPGDLTAFLGYTRDSLLASCFDLIAYDRPGYNLSDSHPVASINSQAKILSDLVELVANKDQSVIFLSHSFGGPIAALSAIQLGEKVIGHVMLSPVIDPASEPMFWYSKLPIKLPFKWISAQPNKTASHEKITHPKQLFELVDKWHQLISPTVMIHGKKDWLAPIANADFVADKFPKKLTNVIVLDHASHFFIWSREEVKNIKKQLLKLAE